VQPDARLIEDLDLDSLDAIDLAVKVEETTGLAFDEEKIRALRTVEDVIVVLQSLVSTKAACPCRRRPPLRPSHDHRPGQGVGDRRDHGDPGRPRDRRPDHLGAPATDAPPATLVSGDPAAAPRSTRCSSSSHSSASAARLARRSGSPCSRALSGRPARSTSIATRASRARP